MKRHRLNIISFFFGILFVGLGVTGALGNEDIALLEARWVWPVLLVAAGVAIIGFTVRPPQSEPRDESADDGF